MEAHEDMVAGLQRSQAIQLVWAAKAFLRTGLNLVTGGGSFSDKQAGVANLSIGIELLLKARLAMVSLGLLFVNLPEELQVAFSKPVEVSSSFSLHRGIRQVESGDFKTQSFDFCCAAWSVWEGERGVLASYLRRVAKLRNETVHGVFPPLDHYEATRVAYTAIAVYQAMLEAHVPACQRRFLTEDDLRLMEEFPKERIERLHRKIANAKAKAQNLKEPAVATIDGSFHQWYDTCPVCGSGGTIWGETEMETNGIAPKYEDARLWFYAESFKCNGCGLELDDPEELGLAGMEVSYDRTEDLNKWMDEREFYSSLGDEEALLLLDEREFGPMESWMGKTTRPRRTEMEPPPEGSGT